MFRKTKQIEITKAEAVTPFKTAFIGGIYGALGTIVATEVFELLSTGVKIISDTVVKKINNRKEQNVNEQFWDELFDEETEEEEE